MALLWLLLACTPDTPALQEDEANQPPAGAFPGTPEDEDTAQAAQPRGLVAIPEVVDFGQIGVDCEAFGAITVQHQGTDEVAFRALLVTGSWNERFSLPEPAPDSLSPGDQFDLTVRFEPDQPGPYLAAVQLYSNEDLFPFAEIPLEGDAREDASCP